MNPKKILINVYALVIPSKEADRTLAKTNEKTRSVDDYHVERLELLLAVVMKMTSKKRNA